MRIALHAPSGYVSAENGGDDAGLLVANRREVGAWETFTLERHPEGEWALKSINGRYLSAEESGGDQVHANRLYPQSWEQWHIVGTLSDGAPIAFRSRDGQHFLSVNDQNVVGAWSTVRVFFQVTLIDAQPVGTLSRLVGIDPSRHRMVNELGEHVYGRGTSFFLSYKRFLQGENLDAQLTQRQELGCNLVRVMGMFENLGGFNPKQFPDYYTRIPEFCNYVAGFGIYILWTACAATGSVFTEDEAIEHIKKTVEQLLTTQNALFSPVNEQGQHNNSINRDRFKRELMDTGKLGWLIYDTGSFGVDLPVTPPFGRYAPFHVRRDYPTSVKDCGIIDHPNRLENHLEIGIDEPYRAGDEGAGDRHDDPIVAREAAGIAYNAIYFVTHTMQGERADVWTGNTLDCVTAALDAMKGH